MKKDITFKDIKRFNIQYSKNPNYELTNKLKDLPLNEVCLNKDIIKENIFEFNIELEDCKIYNQYTSLRCWLYSCLNLIKNNVANNLDINPLDFQLSANYLSFFDKLEKANHLYETIINYKFSSNSPQPFDISNDRYLAEFLKDPVKENGRIEYARELIKKYGIAPYEIMPETYNTKNPSEIINLYSQKCRLDIFKFIEAKKNNLDLHNLKDTLLQENYILLCKLIGQPVKKFDYIYKDKNGNIQKLNNITPLQFYNQFCTINLDDFILVGNVPMSNKPFYKKYRKAFSSNIEGKSYIEFINIPLNEFSNICVKQLKNNLPVCFSCENKKYRNKESKILDTRIFDFEKLFNVKDLNKQQSLESWDISIKHWMVFRGVHIENGKPIRWKVEDTAGVENRINGYYVMNNNYFEKCVFQAWIHKDYLSKEILEQDKSKPILFGYNDSI